MIAYEKPLIIIKQIEELYTEEDYFIVHWNKNSSKKDMNMLKDHFRDRKNIYIFSKHRVYWGDISILDAQLSAMKIALKLPFKWQYFISLSNNCFPVKSPTYIKNFYQKYHNYYPGYSFCPNCEDKGIWEYIEFHKNNQLISNKVLKMIKAFLLLFPVLTDNLFSKQISFKNYLKTIQQWVLKIIKGDVCFYKREDIRYPKFITKYAVGYNIKLSPPGTPDINSTIGQSGPIGTFSQRHLSYIILELSKNKTDISKLYKYFKCMHAPEEAFIYGVLTNSLETKDEIINITLHWTINNSSKPRNTNIIPHEFISNPINFNSCFPARLTNKNLYKDAYEAMLFVRKFNQTEDIDSFKEYRSKYID
ncbi:MAG: beta-1,6-N-acetylglucosaminyltransferase [Brevinema sp.]